VKDKATNWDIVDGYSDREDSFCRTSRLACIRFETLIANHSTNCTTDRSWWLKFFILLTHVYEQFEILHHFRRVWNESLEVGEVLLGETSIQWMTAVRNEWFVC
jgi:hypothetical protein